METLKLTVKNEDRLLKALFDESPRHTYYRELALNSIEAGATELHIDRIKVGRNYKVAFIDDGCGLNEEGLKGLSDLYGSAKGDDHFGTGARILTLSTNEQGVVFQSRVDGVIRYIKYYLKAGSPIFEYSEGEFTSIKPYTDGNYTAVILLGNNAGQDTSKIPYGSFTKDYPFLRQLSLRFFEDFGTKIFVGKELVIPLSKVLRAKGEQYIVSSSKFDILYTIKGDNTSGVVHDGELYYPEKGNRKDGVFTNNANVLLGKLDARSVADSLSVIVKIKKLDVNIKQHRDGILDPDTREEYNLEYFGEIIKRHCPTDVRLYINSKRREAFSNIKVDTGLEKYDDTDKFLSEQAEPEVINEDGLFDPTPTKIERGGRVCPQCGYENKRGAKVCVECGYVFIVSKPKPTDDPKKRPNPKPKALKPYGKDLDSSQYEFNRGEFLIFEGGNELHFNTGSKAFQYVRDQLAGQNIANDVTNQQLAGQIEERLRVQLRTAKVDRETASLLAKAVYKDCVDKSLEKLNKGV